MEPCQLSLDPIWEMEQIDLQLKRRTKGSRPGERLLLTQRRDATRALYAQLRPVTRENSTTTERA